MKRLSLVALVAMLFASILADAQLQNADSNTDITKIESANKSISTMQCSFSRTTKMAAINDAASASGTFYFQSPSNLSMQYTNGEAFVVTEDKVSMTINGKGRAFKAGNKHVEDLSSTLIACVTGQVKNIDGTLESSKTVGKNIVLTISTALSVGRNKIKTLELSYSKTDYSLVSMNLIEADGSYTLYELGDKTTGGKIDSSVFTHVAKEKN